MMAHDLGTKAYRDGWALQIDAHADVVSGAPERILLVEHPPVITLGRRPDLMQNLIAPAERLAALGVEIVQSDRGGDITFHGPGQLVAYPIVRLLDHGLSVGSYVHRLEKAVIAALADFNIEAAQDPSAIGVWVHQAGELRKICALGVRIRRGVSMHGIALNVTTNLGYFDLIVPCGLAGRRVTSMQDVLGAAVPPMQQVKARLVGHLSAALS